jgi:hypothetical protein
MLNRHPKEPHKPTLRKSTRHIACDSASVLRGKSFDLSGIRVSTTNDDSKGNRTGFEPWTSIEFPGHLSPGPGTYSPHVFKLSTRFSFPRSGRNLQPPTSKRFSTPYPARRSPSSQTATPTSLQPLSKDHESIPRASSLTNRILTKQRQKLDQLVCDYERRRSISC